MSCYHALTLTVEHSAQRGPEIQGKCLLELVGFGDHAKLCESAEESRWQTGRKRLAGFSMDGFVSLLAAPG